MKMENKIIVTSTKSFMKYPDLIEKVEKAGGLIIDKYIESFDEILEVLGKGSVLMLDELNIKGDFKEVNKNLDKLKNIKYICGVSSRYHELDLNKINELKIKYCNNPDTTSQSVAELALMHLMLLIRKQPLYSKDDFDFFGMNNLGRELSSLTAGILGYGNIGSKIAGLCSSMGLQVKFWSRSKKESEHPQVSIEELLESDVIFISLISGQESKAIFDKSFYNSLNSRKYIVDIVGDDSLYDKNILINMCNRGEMAGFGFEAESPTSKYEKISGNVSISPHVAWGTEESYRRLIEGWVKTTFAAFEGRPINVVS